MVFGSTELVVLFEYSFSPQKKNRIVVRFSSFHVSRQLFCFFCCCVVVVVAVAVVVVVLLLFAIVVVAVVGVFLVTFVLYGRGFSYVLLFFLLLACCGSVVIWWHFLRGQRRIKCPKLPFSDLR